MTTSSDDLDFRSLAGRFFEKPGIGFPLRVFLLASEAAGALPDARPNGIPVVNRFSLFSLRFFHHLFPFEVTRRPILAFCYDRRGITGSETKDGTKDSIPQRDSSALESVAGLPGESETSKLSSGICSPSPLALM